MKISTKLHKFIKDTADKALSKKEITPKEAHKLLLIDKDNLLFLLGYANIIRKHFRKECVELCFITSAKSGACSEDCAFCSQSSFHKTNINSHPLIDTSEIFKRAQNALNNGAKRFCIVTSGRGILSEKDFKQIIKAVVKIRKNLNMLVDVSLGELSYNQAKILKESGVSRCNHNIETAKSFFKLICTTHTFVDRLNTINNVKKAGIEICCGGIFGLGENNTQRIEFLFNLKKINPECIPLNFLNPIAGTPLENNHVLAPLEILKIIALARFIFPDREIKICGGRERNLRSLQAMVFFAGADSIISGNYLTTKGAPPEEDIQMIKDLELNVK